MTIGEQLQRLWPGWVIDGELGAGSFGKVYRIRRNAYGRTYYSALKHIEIPSDKKQLDILQAEGMDDQSIRSHLSKIVNNCLNEIDIMSRLKGTSNIVYIEDSQVVAHSDGIHWDIFVKMELLSCLIDEMKKSYFTERQVFKVAMDLTNALIQCEKLGMIHRDIKPENVMVSAGGDYKLGDFGAARQMSESTFHMTQIGTVNYMAPELFRGDGYDHRADIYSLGILLYTLANRNRLPFVNPYRQDLTMQEREEATRYRLKGGKLTPPACVRNELGNIILKACKYKPKDRYPSAQAMRQDLIRIMPLILTDETVPTKNNSNNPVYTMTGGRYNASYSNASHSGNTFSEGTVSNKTAPNSPAKKSPTSNGFFNSAGNRTDGNNSPSKNQTGSHPSQGKAFKNQTGSHTSQGKPFKPDFLKIALAIASVFLVVLIAITIKTTFTGKSKKTTSRNLTTAQAVSSSSISASKENNGETDTKEESSVAAKSTSASSDSETKKEDSKEDAKEESSSGASGGNASGKITTLGSADSSSKSKTDEEEDEDAKDTETEDTSDTFTLKPTSDWQDKTLSSVRISAPAGYTLSWADDEEHSYLFAEADTYSDTTVDGFFTLYPNEGSWKSLSSYFDYLKNDSKYTNVVIKDEQRFETSAGTVNYVFAAFTYTSDSGNSFDEVEIESYLEYDNNTLVWFDGWLSDRGTDPTDQLKTIFSGVQAP